MSNKNKKTNKSRMGSNSKKYKIFSCPCGGGQSCIVDRRRVGDWVHEDNLFKVNNLPIRKNCYTPLTIEQANALRPYGFNV